MSIIYCEKHDRRWDSDRLEECPLCENEHQENESMSPEDARDSDLNACSFRELCEAERSSGAEVAHILFPILGWKEGGIGAAADEVSKKLAAARGEAAFHIERALYWERIAKERSSEAVERDAARWRSMQIVMDCITAVERHQMDESQFFGAVVEAFENAMRPGDIPQRPTGDSHEDGGANGN